MYSTLPICVCVYPITGMNAFGLLRLFVLDRSESRSFSIILYCNNNFSALKVSIFNEMKKKANTIFIGLNLSLEWARANITISSRNPFELWVLYTVYFTIRNRFRILIYSSSFWVEILHLRWRRIRNCCIPLLSSYCGLQLWLWLRLYANNQNEERQFIDVILLAGTCKI